MLRVRYERVPSLEDGLWRLGRLGARTVIVDVEPLVAYWDSGQEALDRGIGLVLRQLTTVPGVRVVCFATNSLRRPAVPPGGAGPRVIYIPAAGKPLRTAAYRDLPRPGVVIGDQVATDGILAWRLGFAFVQYQPPLVGVPAGPRLMDACGRLVRPLFFTRAG